MQHLLSWLWFHMFLPGKVLWANASYDSDKYHSFIMWKWCPQSGAMLQLCMVGKHTVFDFGLTVTPFFLNLRFSLPPYTPCSAPSCVWQTTVKLFILTRIKWDLVLVLVLDLSPVSALGWVAWVQSVMMIICSFIILSRLHAFICSKSKFCM